MKIGSGNRAFHPVLRAFRNLLNIIDTVFRSGARLLVMVGCVVVVATSFAQSIPAGVRIDATQADPSAGGYAPYGQNGSVPLNRTQPGTLRLPGAAAGMASTMPIPDSSNLQSDPNFLNQIRPRPAEAEVPSEFQLMVQASSGILLPIYGRDMFATSPLVFAPMDRVPVTADYSIGPGDEIVIRVWGQIDVDFRTVVDRNGEIFIPKVGNLNLTGLKYHQLSGYLKTAIGRVFQNFDLTVSLGQLRSIQIYLVGHANRPGAYMVSSMSTLISALFSAGGPSAAGSMRSIQLKRAGALIAELDLYKLIGSGDMSGDVRLLPGDVIHIPPVGPQAAITGSVNKPAIFEIKGATSFQTLIDLAGGVSAVGSADKVTIERIADRKNRVVEELPWNTVNLDMPVMNGDLYNVWAISPKFERTVTLRGNVQKTSRRPWREGMRLSDLIPSKEVLISPDYWNRQNSLTLKTLRNLPAPTNATKVSPSAASQQANATVTTDPGSRDFSVNAADPSLKKSNDLSLLTKENDDNNDGKIDTGSYIKNDISRMLEEISWDYAVIERLDSRTLEPRLLPFNLGRLVLDKDPAADLELLAGDTVVIFSKSDVGVPISRQTKYITLSGEFKQSGVHQALPGETLRQLVRRVGGFTADAYPYAAEFTRESNRISQARQLQAMLDRMERDIERNASARLQSSADEVAVAAQKAELDSSRATIARLRKMRPTGRIPLELSEDAAIEQVPDLVLEDGDKLMIPPRSTVLSVMGAVYNENTFLYKSSKNMADYLAQAGGPTREADGSRAYILRADGAVSPASSSWFSLGSSVKLMPGDTIVVPEKLDKSTWQKSLRDWTQILYQFGIGAAALKTLTK